MAKKKAANKKEVIKLEAMLHDDDEYSIKEIAEALLDLAGKVPKEVYLSIVLTFAWSKTHSGGVNAGDVALGLVGGFTIPPALQGEIVANGYAVAHLGALGFNLVDTDLNELYDALVSNEPVTAAVEDSAFWLAELLYSKDKQYADECAAKGGVWNKATKKCELPRPEPELVT